MKLPSAKTALTLIVVVFYTITLTTLLASVLRTNHNLLLPGLGNIIALGYKADNNTIDWGTIYVGTSTDRAINLTSKSSTVTTPFLNYGDWKFNDISVPTSLVNNMRLNWSLSNDTRIAPNEKIIVTFTLTIEYDPSLVDYLINNTITTFSFDIIIHPSQV
jgi:hypothetical protein